MNVFVLRSVLMTTEGSATKFKVFKSYDDALTVLKDIKAHYENLRNAGKKISISTFKDNMFMVEIEDDFGTGENTVTVIQHRRYSLETHELIEGTDVDDVL